MHRTLTAPGPHSPEPSFQELWHPGENFLADMPGRRPPNKILIQLKWKNYRDKRCPQDADPE